MIKAIDSSATFKIWLELRPQGARISGGNNNRLFKKKSKQFADHNEIYI